MMYRKQKKRLCIGVTEYNQLVYINLEIGSCDNNHFTITHDNYSGIIDEETGIAEAKERLSDQDYWDGLGFIQTDCFLTRYIDFDEVPKPYSNLHSHHYPDFLIIPNCWTYSPHDENNP